MAELAVATDPKVIEGMELALEEIIAYPGNRDGVSHAATELFVTIQQAKGVALDSPEGEAAYGAYLRKWRP